MVITRACARYREQELIDELLLKILNIGSAAIPGAPGAAADAVRGRPSYWVACWTKVLV